MINVALMYYINLCYTCKIMLRVTISKLKLPLFIITWPHWGGHPIHNYSFAIVAINFTARSVVKTAVYVQALKITFHITTVRVTGRSSCDRSIFSLLYCMSMNGQEDQFTLVRPVSFVKYFPKVNFNVSKNTSWSFSNFCIGHKASNIISFVFFLWIINEA